MTLAGRGLRWAALPGPGTGPLRGVIDNRQATPSRGPRVGLVRRSKICCSTLVIINGREAGHNAVFQTAHCRLAVESVDLLLHAVISPGKRLEGVALKAGGGPVAFVLHEPCT